jgi:hypothetical protein
MKKTTVALLVLVTLAFASTRPVQGRGSATDVDHERARSEAMEQATDNLRNACPSGRFFAAPQVTTDECHMAGPGSETCIVVITAACESD